MTHRLLRTVRPLVLCLFVAAFLAPAAHAQDRMPLTTDSDAARAAFIEARNHLNNVHYTAAQEAVDRAIAEDPTFAAALALRSFLSQRSEAQTTYFKRAKAQRANASPGEQHYIDAYLAYHDQNPKRAYASIQALVEVHPNDPDALLMLGGMAMQYQQDYDTALTAMTRATEIDPTFAPAYNLLGYRAMAVGDMGAAETAFLKYVELRPDDPNPHDSLAEFYLKQGRFDEAVTSYKNAYAKDDTFVLAWTRAAIAMAMNGDGDGARTELKAIFKATTEPEYLVQTHDAMAMTYLFEDDVDGAAKAFDEAIAWSRQDHPDRTTYFLTMKGWTMHENQRFEEASAMTKALKAELDAGRVPDARRAQVAATIDMASAFEAMGMGDDEKAEAHLQAYATYATSNGSPQAMGMLHELKAMKAYKGGDVEGAIAFMKKADDAPMTHYHLGRMYAEMGDAEAAQKHLRKAATANEPTLSFALARNHARRALSM